MELTKYLIISAASLGLSYFMFRLLIRKDTMFLQQRIFLITSVILSALIPLTGIAIHFQEIKTPELLIPQQPAGLNKMLPIAGNDHFRIDSKLILYIYMIIAALFFLTILFQVMRICVLYLASEKTVCGNMIVLRNLKTEQPFSFFNWIFIPRSMTDRTEIQSIFIHESIHARQFHSLDNIILELICAIMWFNPFVWMIKKSIHLLHEYIADEGTLNKGIDKLRYQALLVNQAAEGKMVTIPSGFNSNLLKKRMIMMSKTKMNDTSRVKILSIIPLPIVLLMLVATLNGVFSGEVKAQDKKPVTKHEEITVTGYGRPDNPGYKSNNQKADTIHYIVDGIRVKNIDDINPDSIESVNVLKEDRTVIVRTKGFAAKIKAEAGTFNIRSYNANEKIVYILDDKKISQEEMKSISPSSIESINVIKSDGMIKRYTDEDVDGVIVIKSKK